MRDWFWEKDLPEDEYWEKKQHEEDNKQKFLFTLIAVLGLLVLLSSVMWR